MLQRWTTWIDLAHTGIVTTILVLSETKPGKRYLPFQLHDAAFTTTLAYGAGTGEEALFRGWLYPLLYQKLGRRAWMANGIQATIFGSLHVPQAGAFAADKAIVAGQSIVVIDDVYTTGATLVACAEALRAAGAQQVWALTVASAFHRDADGTT